MLGTETGMVFYVGTRKADMMVDFSERQSNFSELRVALSQFAIHYF